MPHLKKSTLRLCTGLAAIAAVGATGAAGADEQAYQRCLQEQMHKVNPDTPVTNVLQYCDKFKAQQTGAQAAPSAPPAAETPLEQRTRIERSTRYQRFVLTPHKPNYLLPVTYNDSPHQVEDPAVEGALDEVEMKFQLSVKAPIKQNLFGPRSTLYFAYTNQSYWQSYNDSVSRPFRETNHEPEIFFTLPNDWKLAGFTNRLMIFGATHQSNGRSGELSRSWNRIYADFVFERGNFYVSIKPWYRIPESDDDNPDILDFMGHGELRFAYAKQRFTYSFMMRNNLDADNKGAYELNFSFPISDRVKGFAQWFYGYGESLIDYDAPTNRIGIGVALTDWL